MIKLMLFKRKSKMPEADYVLDMFDKFLDLLVVLTPKFKGQWEIVLVDPKITESRRLIEEMSLPEYVDCTLLLPAPKLEAIAMDHPTLAPKPITPKDAYKGMIAGLKHMIDKNAMWMLYNAIGPHVELLQEALDKLDAECEGTSITTKQVQQAYVAQKRTYASEVIAAFLRKDRYRWTKLSSLTRDLGDEYAYNALYKQVRNLLKDKQAYLMNEDVKNRLVEQVDAPFICYAYTLFANSSSWRNLHAIMYAIDARSQDILERSTYVNLQ